MPSAPNFEPACISNAEQKNGFTNFSYVDQKSEAPTPPSLLQKSVTLMRHSASTSEIFSRTSLGDLAEAYFNSSRNLYEQYVNAFAFSEMVKSQNASPSKRELQQQAQSIEPSISSPTSPNPPNIHNDTQFSINAVAQKRSDDIINQAKTELYEYNNLLRTATSSALHTQIFAKIKKLEGTIIVEESKIKKLKGNAAAQNRA
ncbi:hypothetical protein C1645_840854 [Glomus cerebriforme]|uniref:Uncharacterized protein n=1 Tax=Glomus cerebriforme TaxID=658196 RepID=A0A397S3T0_9GLOM|nr:hypothetical protein C1645_840854 [Glomus cerebriforme]